MGCCSGFARFILFALNITTFLCGLALIVVGVIYEIGFIELTNKLDQLFPALHLASIFLIVAGGIIFIISFLGCCGAWRRSSCMLLTYAVILIIMLLLQIALAVYIFITVNNSDDWRRDLADALENMFHGGNHSFIDFFQQTLECCGFREMPPFIPSSCCAPNDILCQHPFPRPCEYAFYTFVRYSMNIIAIVALSLAAIQFVCALIATCVSRQRKTEHTS